MAYVDPNPVRAEVADRPETSSHTSIRERLLSEFDLQQAIDDQTQCGDLFDFKSTLKPLLHFENRLKNEPQRGILFNFEEYLALVDWTGRIIRSDKRGHIGNTYHPYSPDCRSHRSNGASTPRSLKPFILDGSIDKPHSLIGDRFPT
jgi:hypothetical protein